MINLDFSFVDNHSPASLILDVTHRAFDFNKIPNVDAVEVSRELSTLGKPRIIVREVYFDDELDRTQRANGDEGVYARIIFLPARSPRR